MAQAATECADRAERAALALDGLERVSRAAPFAERFGQDFGHRLPGSISKPAASGTGSRGMIPAVPNDAPTAARTPTDAQGYRGSAMRRPVRGAGPRGTLW